MCTISLNFFKKQKKKSTQYVSFVSYSCCDWLVNICQRKKELKARTVWLGCPEKCEEKHPRNSIKNQKYNVFTFIPGVRLLHSWRWVVCQTLLASFAVGRSLLRLWLRYWVVSHPNQCPFAFEPSVFPIIVK